MNYYFAPLEGITGYTYRKVYHQYFEDYDKYYLPFMSPGENKGWKTRERKDVLPENNEGITVVPQILTNNYEVFIHSAEQLCELGYKEVNLNLGCPAGTVVSKKKGSGLLTETYLLENLLDGIFYDKFLLQKTDISIKTRIGRYGADEFEELLALFNKYPIKELIIHPRVQKDFYGNEPNLEAFAMAVENSKNPLCYNGDLFKKEDLDNLKVQFPTVNSVMIGRGSIANPNLLGEIKNGTARKKQVFEQFHKTLYTEYEKELYGEKTVLFKLKEVWFYMLHMFTNYEKYWKKIKKVQKAQEYHAIIRELFKKEELLENGAFLPKK